MKPGTTIIIIRIPPLVPTAIPAMHPSSQSETKSMQISDAIYHEKPIQ